MRMRGSLLRSTAIAAAILGNLAAQTAPAPPQTGSVTGVRHIIGLDDVKSQRTGSLSVQADALVFDGGTSHAAVQVASIEDVFLGAEVTQAGGKTARVMKTAAIAAPYESGKVLTLLLRTKVDILTVVFHDANGGLHSAIFAVPKGKAAAVRTQLIAAGAHATALDEEAKQ